jgi:heme-degrading monooxygenase HmoA
MRRLYRHAFIASVCNEQIIVEVTVVRLINCFEVPGGRDEEFLQRFRAVNAYMVSKPGYCGHHLHKALAPDARYRFVNYVEWQSPEHLAAARDERYRDLVRAVGDAGFTSTHALYDVVHEGRARDFEDDQHA